MNITTQSFTALTLAASLAGCAAPGYYGYNHAPYRGTVTGAAVGAAGGALLGYAADGGYGNGALVGGALGALAGGAAGYYFDQRRDDPNYRPDPYYRGSRDYPGHRPTGRYAARY